MTLAIKNGHLINPVDDTSMVCDVLIENDLVLEIGNDLNGDDTIDATGCIVAPGLVDIHCHFREPGYESKETIASGSRAAAKGGFTTVVTMGNTNPPIDNAGLVELIIKRAREEACIRVRPAACATKGLKSEEITEMADLKDAGAIAVTDDGKDIASSRVMRYALEYANMVGMPFLSHCEDEQLAEGGVMNEGYMATLMGLPGIPKAAEEVRIDRNIRLAELAGAHIHIQHVSNYRSLLFIERAKERGVRVTCEVTPHHLTMTEEDVAEYDTNYKMNPPLGSAEDRAALIEGLRDGTLDVISSDHAPHCGHEKEVEYDVAPFGIIGLETELGMALTSLYHRKVLSLSEIIRKFTAAPAELLRIDKGTLSVGVAADITVFDPEEEWVYDAAQGASKSQNSPFDGWPVKGRVHGTWVAGRQVYSLEKQDF